MLSNYFTLLLFFFGLVKAQGTYDSTTTVTTTPYVTFTTTVGLIEEIFETVYIYTNSDNLLTTSTIVGSTAYVFATGSSDTASTVTDSATPSITTISSMGSSLSAFISASDAVSKVTSSLDTSPTTSLSVAPSSSGYSSRLESPPLTSSAFWNSGISSISSVPVFPTSSSLPVIFFSSRLASPSSSPIGSITEVPLSVPKGTYSTSTSTSLTILEDRASAVIEYIILFTSDCSA